MQLTAKDVSAISHTARSTKTRTRRAAFDLLKLTDSRLKAAAKGELTLDASIYLPMPKIVELLWRVRKLASQQWQAGKAEQRVQRATAGLPLFVFGDVTSDDVPEEGAATLEQLERMEGAHRVA